MARLKVFSVYDSKIKAYMQPFFMQHAGQALRSWENLVNDGQSTVSQHPGDFTLMEIGTFDDEKGVLESYQAAISTQTALAAKRKPEGTLPLSM